MPLLNPLWIVCSLLISPAISLPEKLYNRAFSVIWNVPSRKCSYRFNKDFRLSNYNIIQNTDDKFQGDKMMIYYEPKLGLYPHIDSNGSSINGGIPQLVDKNAHLCKAEKDIKNTILSEDFIGPAVVDWEAWRPTYDRNFGKMIVYKKASGELVRKQHPNISSNEIYYEAKKVFTKAASDMFSCILTMGQRLRKKARWGFYLFPKVYPKYPFKSMEDNDNLGWLFSLSTGLFPSIYLYAGNTSSRYQHVARTLMETFRVYDKFSQKNRTVIVPYAKYRLESPKRFQNKQELILSLVMPAVAGTAGVILWDSSANLRTVTQCTEMENFIRTSLGPFVKHLTDAMENCSKKLCNGNGRCVISPYLIDMESLWVDSIGWAEKLLDGIAAHNKPFNKGYFFCQCYSMYKGKHCESTNS